MTLTKEQKKELFTKINKAREKQIEEIKNKKESYEIFKTQKEEKEFSDMVSNDLNNFKTINLADKIIDYVETYSKNREREEIVKQLEKEDLKKLFDNFGFALVNKSDYIIEPKSRKL